MWLRDLCSKIARHYVITLSLSAMMICTIFIPFQGVNAVKVELTNQNIQAGYHTVVDLKITAQNPSTIPFPGGMHSETIPNGEIRVTLDAGTADEKIVRFSFAGSLLSDTSGGIITSLTFDGITHGTNNIAGIIGNGSYHGYGFGIDSGVSGNVLVGNDSTVTGISSQPYGEDTAGTYKINFNPLLLSIGNHKIRVDVLANSSDVKFFSSGDVSFTNSTPLRSSSDDEGSSYVPPSISFKGMDVMQKTLTDDMRNNVLNHDPLKPISPSYDSFVDYPLLIDGGGYVLVGLTNTIVTQTEKTGIPADVKLNIPSSNIQHVALYTNLRGDARDIDKSDTYIIYEKGKPLQIVDPYGYFADVKFNMSTNGINNAIVYTITFAKPMEKSDIDLRVWDDHMHSSDNRILDAWQVKSQTSTSSSQTGSIATSTVPMSITMPVQNVVHVSTDPSNQVLDSKLLYSMGVKGNHIPSWVMKLTKHITNGDISEKDFVNSIMYLSSTGIIK